MSERAALIGGPCDGRTVELSRTPPRIEAAGVIYRRLDDPDTGEFLGGYVVTQPSTAPQTCPDGAQTDMTRKEQQ